MPGDLSERETRKRFIDPILERWGWSVVPCSDDLPASGSFAIEEYPTEAGPADYALYSDGRVIGIVEAKRLTVSPQGVLTQAERYSRGISGTGQDYDGFRAPFLYSTNCELVEGERQ